MPLIQGCSKEAAKKNYRREYRKFRKMGKSHEKAQKQAFAIAFDIARKNINKCGRKRKSQIKNGKLFG